MPVNKNAYKRYLIIHNHLSKFSRTASKDELLDLLERSDYGISERQFDNDIREMRYTFNLPIKFKPKEGYYYSEPDVSFDLPLSDSDIKIIYRALDNLAFFYQGSAYRNTKRILEKIMKRLNMDVKQLDDHGRGITSMYIPDTPPKGSQWIPLIYDAIANRKRITLTSDVEGESCRHTLEPYLLKEYAGRWYVIGREDQKQSFYRLDQISELKVTREDFKLSDAYREDLIRKVDPSAGAAGFEAGRHKVFISYDKSLAEQLKANPINETQQIEREDERNIYISAEVSISEEFILKAILPYGDKVRLEGPNIFIDILRGLFARIIDKYDLKAY